MSNFSSAAYSSSTNNPNYAYTSTSIGQIEDDSAPVNQQDVYYPVNAHWFYTEGSDPISWKPFSFKDSINLEEAYRTGSTEPVHTDGGRYDVNIKSRSRFPVYWDGEKAAIYPFKEKKKIEKSNDRNDVRRCTWFRKSALEMLPQPYDEDSANFLETVYKECVESGKWNRKIEMVGENPGSVAIVSPNSMSHYSTIFVESVAADTVKRGTHDFEIPDGETDQIDHLLFLIHGIGPVCDLRFRPVELCVDGFRELGSEIIGSHFKEAVDSGKVGRVEILPISWHKALHSEGDGIDSRIKPITLRSIPLLREFTNDTILDVLLYTSPTYCQVIMDTVVSELNRLYNLFMKRNPTFKGNVSVAGHSLGAVIVFDLLMHQKPWDEKEENNSAPAGENPEVKAKSTLQTSASYELGPAGTGQPNVRYSQLEFQPYAAFFLGSPTAMFLTVRGLTDMDNDYHLPTCRNVFNIYHPFDPVAYRMETLVNPHLTDLRPVLIPHHKGRKRMHLELKDTIERVGGDIKQKIIGSFSSTWNRMFSMYSGAEAAPQIEGEVKEEVGKQFGEIDGNSGESFQGTPYVGQLNSGRRIDFILQEKPYESFTEYIFALQTHLCYWESEDTMLMMLKEMYRSMDIQSDGDTGEVPPTNSSDTPAVYPQSTPTVPLHEAESPPPVPLFFNPSTIEGGDSTAALASRGPPMVPSIPLSGPPMVPPIPLSSQTPKVLCGRPVVDPFSIPDKMGMDPTADPQLKKSEATPPPLPPASSSKGVNAYRISKGFRK